MANAGPSTASGSDDAWSRVFAFTGSIVFVGTVLMVLKPILVPFVLAIFLAYLVRPFAEWISTSFCACRRRRRSGQLSHQRDKVEDPEETDDLLPKESITSPAASLPGAMYSEIQEAAGSMEAALPYWVGVLLAMGMAITLICTVVVLMSTSIASLGSRIDAYQARAHELWSIAAFHLRPLGLELPDELILPSTAISAHLAPLLNAGLGLLNDFILVLIFLVFLLLDKRAQGRSDERSSLRRRIDDSVSRYLVLKSLICFGLATFTYVVLYVLNFPLALFVAIVTYILSFIPNLGPMVAALLPLPICLLDVTVLPGNAALCVALPALAHVVVGNLFEPRLFGSQFRMSPVVILFSLGVWWTLWGIVGAMLAVPLTSILRIIASDLIQTGEGGYFIVVINQMLEGRPLDAINSGVSKSGASNPNTPARRSAGAAAAYGGAQQHQQPQQHAAVDDDEEALIKGI